MSIKRKWETFKYKISHMIFQWNTEEQDDGGSIVFTVCNFIHFVKYREHTLIYFEKNRYKPARKYVEAFKEN